MNFFTLKRHKLANVRSFAFVQNPQLSVGAAAFTLEPTHANPMIVEAPRDLQFTPPLCTQPNPVFVALALPEQYLGGIPFDLSQPEYAADPSNFPGLYPGLN